MQHKKKCVSFINIYKKVRREKKNTFCYFLMIEKKKNVDVAAKQIDIVSRERCTKGRQRVNLTLLFQ